MNPSDVDTKDLTSAKRLWDIYRASRRIPFSTFNLTTTITVALLLIITAIYSSMSTSFLVSFMREMATFGLSTSLSVLALLVAGFTIFATLTSPQLSLARSRSTNKKSGLTHLKHNYFVFIRVFIYYITFSVFCLSMVMFGHEGGLASILLILLPDYEQWRSGIVRVLYVVFFSGFYFIIMQLKSFVFNMYHSVMTTLRWEAENPSS